MASSSYVDQRYADDRSTQQLWSDMTREASALPRKEVELAKMETKEQLTKTGKAGVMFSATGVTAFMASKTRPATPPLRSSNGHGRPPVRSGGPRRDHDADPPTPGTPPIGFLGGQGGLSGALIGWAHPLYTR